MTVEDRGSAIRVERLTAIPVGAKGYVKVETNMGVVGWGEINNVETKVACALAESLGSLIIGENPTRIEFHWQRLFRAHRNLRGGGLMMHVIAAGAMGPCRQALSGAGVSLVGRSLPRQGVDVPESQGDQGQCAITRVRPLRWRSWCSAWPMPAPRWGRMAP